MSLALLAFLRAGPAGAEVDSAALRLTWTAPPSCPGELSVVRRVEDALGQRLSEERAPRLLVRGRVAGSERSGYAAEVTLVTASGSDTRTFVHPDCKRATEDASLVIAQTLDPERVRAVAARDQTKGTKLLDASPYPDDKNVNALVLSKPSASASGSVYEVDVPRATAVTVSRPVTRVIVARSSPPTPPAVVPDVVIAEAPSEPEEVEELEVMPSAQLLTSAGILPAAGAGLGLGVAASREHFRVVLQGRYWFGQSRSLNEVEPQAVNVSLLSMGVRICSLPYLGSWVLAGCLGPDFGDMAGSGEHLDTVGTQHELWSAVMAGVELGYRGAGRLVPVMGFEAGVALARPSFRVRQDQQDLTIFRASPLAMQGYLGLGLVL